MEDGVLGSSDKTGGKKRRSDTGTIFLTEEPCTAVVETLTAEITGLDIPIGNTCMWL